MPLLTVEYHFAASEELWSAVPGDAQVNMAWFPPHKGRGVLRLPSPHLHQTNPLLSTMGGCIRTTARANASAATNTWSVEARWTGFGVPVGATVVRAKADYIWRIDLKSHSRGRSSDAVWGSNALGSGPFILRNSALDPIGTFSAVDYAPARASGGALQWPNGTGADLVSFTPPSWKLVSGAGVSIPSASRAANSRVTFELASSTPATTAGSGPRWIRLKQDYVKIVIEYNTGSNYFQMF